MPLEKIGIELPSKSKLKFVKRFCDDAKEQNLSDFFNYLKHLFLLKTTFQDHTPVRARWCKQYAMCGGYSNYSELLNSITLNAFIKWCVIRTSVCKHFWHFTLKLETITTHSSSIGLLNSEIEISDLHIYWSLFPRTFHFESRNNYNADQNGSFWCLEFELALVRYFTFDSVILLDSDASERWRLVRLDA